MTQHPYKYADMIEILVNRELSEGSHFRRICRDNNINATRRQARKFLRGRGKAFNVVLNHISPR